MNTLKSIILVAALFLPAGHSVGAQSKTKTVGPISPDALIAELYRQTGKNRSPFFQTKNRARVDKYFQKNLADLIWKDAIRSKGEVGAIDGDPLYNAQDMDIKNFIVHKASIGNGISDVRVTFENFGKKEEIVFLLSSGKRSTGWKIANVQYSDGTDLLGILKGGN
jgi:hypothetical protein